MKKFSFHLFPCFMLLFACSVLQAQNANKNNFPLFVDAEFGGAFLGDYFNNRMYAVSGGYLFKPDHGIGLEMRSIKGTSGQHITMQGLGLTYRLAKRRLYAKVAVGTVLDVSYTSSEGFLWKYSDPRGGFYTTHTVGLRFARVCMLGLNCTLTNGINYRYSYGQHIYNNEGNRAVFYHPSESKKVSFVTLSLVAAVSLN